MSSEKAKKKLDKILELVQERLGDEVGGLMGTTLVLSDLQTRLISKEDYFDEPSGKLVFSEMELSGELEGNGGLFISVKDAVRLGGTLIMLPENELEECVSSEDYSEEIDDSYGEIANLIAGSYTSTFEEMYPKKFRFIRKTSEVIIPMKVDIDSDKPVPNQNYYQASASMKLNDVEMGQLTLLMPSLPFGLGDEPQAADGQETETASQAETTQSDSPADKTAEEQAQEQQAEPTAAEEKSFDINKQKKRVDACLAECCKRMEDEVGALLGAKVVLSDHSTRIVSKEDYYMDEASGKQILAHMDIVGELEGKSYLHVGLKDAIHIGGTLIMLPPDELEKVVKEGEFSDDSEDAYGEIANIISGVYTKVFEEQYPEKIRFIKTDLEEIVPMKVDVESDDPMPDILYYMATSCINIDGKDLGNLQMLLPANIFQLEGLGQTETADEMSAAESKAENSVTGKAADGGTASRAGAVEGGEETQTPEFLLVSNDETECSKIAAVFDGRGSAYKVLDFKDNVSNYLPGDVRAVFLLMTSVDEKGLGVAIKISAASSLPLIVAGPEWTRTKVIKAVKYGVNDILLTPASDDDIIEKIDSLQVKKAA